MKSDKAAGTGRLYRRIWIYETETGHEITAADGKVYQFDTWFEACAFVDAWYACQAIVPNN